MESSPELRASDAERDQVAEVLRSHAAQGRLELDDRLGAAYAARTRGDLAVLTADLPPAPPAPPPPVPVHRRLPESLQAAAARWATLSAAALLVWAATGDGLDDFWPKWVLLATTVVAILRIGGARDRRMG
jgi:CO/xanthine dehydrogenase Mo-binding subunit